jgi:DNA-binding transcriptional LysR family regulator
MAKLDLNLLPIAVALYDRRSVSQAAQALGMSQPAVSAALGRLRAHFGDPLFVRTARGMEPTPRAISLVAPARGVLARIEAEVLSDVAFEPTATTRTFTFALSDVGEMVFLPRILDSLRRQAPNASVRSVTLPVAEVERGLESGDIDLAIGYFPDLRKQNYFQQRLFTDTFACLLRADHPIRGNRLSLKQFLGLGHAVAHAEGRSQEVFERFLARKGIRRKVVLTTPHYMSIPVIVAQSDLAVTVPQPLAMYFSRLTANLKIVTLSLAIPRIDLKSHWHRKYQNDAANRWLRGLVATLFHG